MVGPQLDPGIDGGAGVGHRPIRPSKTSAFWVVNQQPHDTVELFPNDNS